jgi:N-ethylmaleimide reductase
MSALFEAIKVDALALPNRMIMAPRGCSEPRAFDNGRNEYVRRASAGLIVSEATHVSADSVSRPVTSAIYNHGQVAA